MKAPGPVEDVEESTKILKDVRDQKQSSISIMVKVKPQDFKNLSGRASFHIQKIRDETRARIFFHEANDSIIIVGNGFKREWIFFIKFGSSRN